MEESISSDEAVERPRSGPTGHGGGALRVPALRRAPGARSLSAVFGRHNGLRAGGAISRWWLGGRAGAGKPTAARPGSPGRVLECPRIVVRCEHSGRLWAWGFDVLARS